MPAPSPVVPVCTVTGIPSAAAVSKIGYTARSSGRKPCAVGCSFRPRSPRSRTARSQLARPRRRPCSGSTDANPTNASGCARDAAGDEVVRDRRQPGVASPRPTRTAHRARRRRGTPSAICVDVVVRQRRAEVRLARGTELAHRVVDVLGSRRVHVHVDRPHGMCRLRLGRRPRRMPDRLVRVVPAVARLGQRVGTERGERLGREQLLDRGRDLGIAVGEIEVVHDLRALVAHVAVVLERRSAGSSAPEAYRRASTRANSGDACASPELSTVSDSRRASSQRDQSRQAKRRRCSGWTPPGGPVVLRHGLAAAHLQGPRFIVHLLDHLLSPVRLL